MLGQSPNLWKSNRSNSENKWKDFDLHVEKQEWKWKEDKKIEWFLGFWRLFFGGQYDLNGKKKL